MKTIIQSTLKPCDRCGLKIAESMSQSMATKVNLETLNDFPKLCECIQIGACFDKHDSLTPAARAMADLMYRRDR